MLYAVRKEQRFSHGMYEEDEDEDEPCVRPRVRVRTMSNRKASPSLQQLFALEGNDSELTLALSDGKKMPLDDAECSPGVRILW